MRKDESNEPITSVIFRRWRNEGKEPIALFPYLPSDNTGRFILSYQHVGQHGGASYPGILGLTVPASTKEPDVMNLYKELQGRGYRLKVIKRAYR